MLTTTTPYGLFPVAIVAVFLNVIASITESVLAPWLVT
jgi:hypothetical protein